MWFLLVLLLVQTSRLCYGNLLGVLNSLGQCSKFTNEIISKNIDKEVSDNAKLTVFAVDDSGFIPVTSIQDYFIFYKEITSNNWNTGGEDASLIDIGYGRVQKVDNYHLFKLNSPTGPVLYANSMKVIKPDVTGNLVTVHVVDKTLGQINQNDIWDYMKERSDLSISLEMWQKLRSLNPNVYDIAFPKRSGCYSTYFLLSNSGWNQIPYDKRIELMSKPEELAKVLSYQIAPNQLIYSEWFNSIEEIKFYAGLPKICSNTQRAGYKEGKVYKNQQGRIMLTIDGNSVQILSETNVISHGNVYLVDKLIGFLFESSTDLMKKHSNMFYILCNSNEKCSQLMSAANKDTTIFVPNSAVANLIQTLPQENQIAILSRMILPTAVSSEKFANQIFDVDGIPQAVRLKKDSQGSWIEAKAEDGSYTRAKITNPDLPTTNGPTVQVINDVPGLVRDPMTKSLESFNVFGAYLKDGYPDKILAKGGKYTCIIPTNDAISLMKGDKLTGEVIVNNATLYDFVIRRHCFPVHLILSSLNNGKKYVVPTANYAFNREVVNLKMMTAAPNYEAELSLPDGPETIKISAMDGSYSTTNGLWYTGSKILYSRNDLTRTLCNSTACINNK